MDKVLAGKLNSLIGDEERWNILLQYLDEEEEMLYKIGLNAKADDLVRNQGKLQFVAKLKNLRNLTRDSLKNE